MVASGRYRSRFCICRPHSRALNHILHSLPSSELLGYSRFVRFADSKINPVVPLSTIELLRPNILDLCPANTLSIFGSDLRQDTAPYRHTLGHRLRSWVGEGKVLVCVLKLVIGYDEDLWTVEKGFFVDKGSPWTAAEVNGIAYYQDWGNMLFMPVDPAVAAYDWSQHGV